MAGTRSWRTTVRSAVWDLGSHLSLIGLALIGWTVVLTGLQNVFPSREVRIFPGVDWSSRVEPVSQSSNYFTTGSTTSEVLAVQGPPTRISGSVWYYGLSVVKFRDGRVVEWISSSRNPLRAGPLQEPPAGRYIWVGASRADVLSIQGKPTGIRGNVWYYGQSEVWFRGDYVISWYSASTNPLKVRSQTGTNTGE